MLGPDIQFFEEDQTSKTGECLLKHPQWPVIFYKALDQSKKLKNDDFTAYIVFYLVVGSETGYPSFLKKTGPQKPVNACWDTHSDRSFYKALDRLKKLKNNNFTTYIVLYPIVGSETGCPIFWGRPDPKNRRMLVETPTVTGHLLQGSGPAKKIKKWWFYSLYSFLPNSRLRDRIFICEEHRSPKYRWMLVETPIVIGHLLQGSGPAKKLKNVDFTAYIVYYLIVRSETGYSLVRNTGAQKTGECLLRHPQWPVIFYKALDQPKKLKNVDFTAYIVYYLIVSSETGCPIFWGRPDLKNRWMLVETSTVTGHFLQGSGLVKK